MNTKPAKVVGLLSTIAGLILVVAGVAVWLLISSQLSAQRITVAPDSGMLPGAKVQGPFSAYAEAQIIEQHATKATGGKTYAELGADQSKLVADAKAAGIEDLTSTDPAVIAQNMTNPRYAEIKAAHDDATKLRNTAMNASFLRASLFTSVVSYGVAAFAIGMGVMFLLFGWALSALGRRPATAEASSTRKADKE